MGPLSPLAGWRRVALPGLGRRACAAAPPAPREGAAPMLRLSYPRSYPMSALPLRRAVAAGLPLVLILGALLACAPATPTTSAPAVGPAAAAGSATTAPLLSARPLVPLKVAWFTVGGQSAP